MNRKKKEESVTVIITSSFYSYIWTHFLFLADFFGRFYYNLHFTGGKTGNSPFVAGPGFKVVWIQINTHNHGTMLLLRSKKFYHKGIC